MAAHAYSAAMKAKDAQTKSCYLEFKGIPSGFDSRSLVRIFVGIFVLLGLIISFTALLFELGLPLYWTKLVCCIGLPGCMLATIYVTSWIVPTKRMIPSLWFKRDQLIYSINDGKPDIRIKNQSIRVVKNTMSQITVSLQNGRHVPLYKRYQGVTNNIVSKIFSDTEIPENFKRSHYSFLLKIENGELVLYLEWMDSERMNDLKIYNSYSEKVLWPKEPENVATEMTEQSTRFKKS